MTSLLTEGILTLGMIGHIRVHVISALLPTSHPLADAEWAHCDVHLHHDAFSSQNVQSKTQGLVCPLGPNGWALAV